MERGTYFERTAFQTRGRGKGEVSSRVVVASQGRMKTSRLYQREFKAETLKEFGLGYCSRGLCGLGVGCGCGSGLGGGSGMVALIVMWRPNISRLFKLCLLV